MQFSRFGTSWRICRAAISVAFVFASFLASGCSALDWINVIRGSVIDSVTKKPIPGAVVYVDRSPTSPQGNGPLGNPDQDKRGHQQVTDVSGQFVFRGLD